MATEFDLSIARRGSSPREYDEALIHEYLAKFQTPGGQKGDEGRMIDAAPEDLASKPYTIFSNRLCPFAHRAYFTLLEKGLLEDGTFDYVHIDLGANKPAWYQESVNPSGTVPCVFQADRPVFESSVIVEYLDEQFADREPKLFPGDAVENAKIRVFVSEFNSNCIRPFYGLLMNKDPALDAEKADAARDAIVKLNGYLAKGSDSGPYFLGDKLSAADVTAAPFIARFVHTLGFYRGFDLLPAGDADTARVRAMLEAVSSRDAFKQSFPGPEYFLAAYYKYAAPADK
jgi:glutathione S-transferase